MQKNTLFAAMMWGLVLGLAHTVSQEPASLAAKLIGHDMIQSHHNHLYYLRLHSLEDQNLHINVDVLLNGNPVKPWSRNFCLQAGAIHYEPYRIVIPYEGLLGFEVQVQAVPQGESGECYTEIDDPDTEITVSKTIIVTRPPKEEVIGRIGGLPGVPWGLNTVSPLHSWMASPLQAGHFSLPPRIPTLLHATADSNVMKQREAKAAKAESILKSWKRKTPDDEEDEKDISPKDKLWPSWKARPSARRDAINVPK